MDEPVSSVIEATRPYGNGSQERRCVGESAAPANQYILLGEHMLFLSLQTDEHRCRGRIVFDDTTVSPLALQKGVDSRLGCQMDRTEILQVHRVRDDPAFAWMIEVVHKGDPALRRFHSTDTQFGRVIGYESVFPKCGHRVASVRSGGG